MAAGITVDDTLQYTITSCTDEMTNFRCVWTIADYKNIKNLKHPEFVKCSRKISLFPEMLTMRFRFYPHEDATHKSGFYAFNDGFQRKEAWMLFKIAILDVNGKEHFVKFDRKIGNVNNIATKSIGWGYSNWFKADFYEDKVDKFIPYGSLQILVHGVAWTKDPKLKLVPSVEMLFSDSSTLLSSLLHNGTESDATFVVGERKFNVHKNILASASPVFKHIFHNQNQNTVIVSNVSEETLEEVIRFIYTSTFTSAIDNLLPEVIRVAERYKLFYLKLACETKMVKRLEIHNAVQFLKIACEVNSRELEETAQRFILNHEREIIEDGSWQDFVSLQYELLQNMCERLRMTM